MTDSGITVFNYLGDSGAEVFIVGDFNAWQRTPMAETVVDDTSLISNYHCELKLSPGRHQYKFVVDGEYITDPDNDETIENALGSLNSVVVVPEKESTDSDIVSGKLSASSIMESIMKENGKKKANDSVKSKWDYGANGADIRPVSQITCPFDKTLTTKIDEGVISKFKETIARRCEEVKALLDVIEEYNTVTNGIIEMEGNVLYSSAINAVMPTELPKAISLSPGRDAGKTPEKLAFEGYLPFGAKNGFKGVVPSFSEFKKLLEIPDTPLDDFDGYLLCSEYSGNGGVRAGFFQNPLPETKKSFDIIKDKIMGSHAIHKIAAVVDSSNFPGLFKLLDSLSESVFDSLDAMGVCEQLLATGIINDELYISLCENGDKAIEYLS
ncbi:MAG: glycogen-binding domain-containing protein, partial [Victivallales bacterium]|nr:glycogen-binding domain-containing protein [Victivallales bacterium]